MYAKVIIDSNSRFLDRSFTYKVPDKFLDTIQTATRVLVPFGKGDKTVVAFVYELVDEVNTSYTIKEIIEIIDDRELISNELMDLAFFMSKRYMSPIKASLKQVMPPTKVKDIKIYYENISDKSDEFLDYLNKRRELSEIASKFKNYKQKLDYYLERDLIKQTFDIKSSQRVTYDEIANLNENINIKLGSNAKKQIEIVNYLKDNGSTNIKKLLSETKSSKSSLDSLVKKSLVFITKIEKNKEINVLSNSYKKFDLNDEQEKAFQLINEDRQGKFLLYGVTGSGKTEIFLQVVEEIIKEGKQAIILVPEISLTPQTIERFKGRFNEKIAIFHSNLTPKEKFNQWRMINNGEVNIAIGARSAIFAPFKNLGIIIIDEEHDQSYISSMDPKYHTAEIAKKRADYNSCNLILASATPSITSMQEVEKGEFQLIKLENRVNNNMPNIEIVDMKDELKASNYSMISRKLYKEISYNLDNSEQTILFLNKVGHDSFTFCRSCGYVIKCEACDVSMTYHKHIDRLVCHYCGRTYKQPRICPICHSKKIKEFGAGTEKLEEEIRRMFPHAKVMRMDSVTATNKQSYFKMYEGMKSNAIDILIGTQMVAKGLDFKNVSLVGIVSADLSLNVGDFKANETTFQLLTQVSGRAGRDKLDGRVIIQSYKPNNFVIQSAKNNDYNYFYHRELDLRRSFNYPPYKNIITIKIINESRPKTINISKKLYKELVNKIYEDKVEIIGPNPCKISRINNKFRYNILIKVEDEYLDNVLRITTEIRKEYINLYRDTSFIPALNPVNIN